MGIRSAHAPWLGGVWLLVALYLVLGGFVFRGWIPHDEGLLAESAERALAGELPHRDFAEAYTGGLTYLHAIAFRVFGVKLSSLRITLLLFTLAFVPALYGLAARVAHPALAALLTLLGVSWSVPNYFAALPSWYVLFLCTFGTLCLLRHLDTERTVWLVSAGLAGGLAVLVKSVGVYFLAAAALFLVHREQVDAARREGTRSPVFVCLKAVGLLTFVTILVALVARRMAPSEFVHFVLPGMAICTVLLVEEWREGRGAAGWRIRRLGSALLPLAISAATPIVVFAVPYVLRGALPDLWQGVVVTPQRRFAFAVYPLPAAWTVVAALPAAAVVVAPRLLSARRERWLLVPLVILLAAVLKLSGREAIYRAVFYSARHLPPLIVLAGCVRLLLPGTTRRLSPARRLEMLLMLSVLAMLSLIQFPYAFGIYFCYVAPLVAPAALYVVTAQERAPVRTYLCVIGFYVAFALCWLNTGFVRRFGDRYVAVNQDSPLALERGGLRVTREDAATYVRLVAEIQRHATPGSFIYAVPDCPQVYFLSETRSPTGTMYDVFDADFDSDPEGRTRRILEALETHHVNLVVMNWQPEFTRSMDLALYRALMSRFPNETRVAPFTVRWRG